MTENFWPLLLFISIVFLGLYALPEIELDEDGNEDFSGRDLAKEKANKENARAAKIRELKP